MRVLLEPAARREPGARWVNSSTDQYALRGERGSRSFAARADAGACRSGAVRAECDAVCAAFSNTTPPTIRTALTISRRKIVNGMPPNLLAHYCYLWEPTAVRQAIETAWISASVRRTFVEVLVPVG